MNHERGTSVSVFAAMLVPCLILVAGLAVDGTRQHVAERRAEAVAAQAARAGAKSWSARLVEGVDGDDEARAAAQDNIAATPDMTGEVRIEGELVVVETRCETSTVFLSLVGITVLESNGYAEARVDEI